MQTRIGEAQAREDAVRKEVQAREDAVRKEVQARENAARMEIAFRYGERWNHPLMFDVRGACREMIAKRASPEELKTTLIADDDAKTKANNVMNFFDELALSVRIERADEALVKRQFDGIVTSVYQAMSKYREYRVQQTGREQIWGELKWLYERWS